MSSVEGMRSPAVHRGGGVLQAEDNGIPELEKVVQRHEEELSHRLSTGGSLSIDADHGTDRLTLRSSTGEVQLTVLVTEDGPVLRFRAADLDIETKGRLRLDCSSFELRADEASYVIEGDVKERIGGDLEVSANACSIQSRRGDVRVWANDDVRLNGERVRLNC